MAGRKAANKSTTTAKTTEKATVVQATVADNTEVENVVAEEEKKTNTRINTKIDDSEEIAVESLIPHVFYDDQKSGDSFEWDEVGHVEYMKFETIKNMWRNHKGYFKNLCLKPEERVIAYFGLENTYAKYAAFMDASNYDKSKINGICNDIEQTPNGLKVTIFNKIRNMVDFGEISDIIVIKTLERKFDLDLISSL